MADDGWPVPLRKWVERAFSSCKTEMERNFVEKQIRMKIHNVNALNTMGSTDWEREPLPDKCDTTAADREGSWEQYYAQLRQHQQQQQQQQQQRQQRRQPNDMVRNDVWTKLSQALQQQQSPVSSARTAASCSTAAASSSATAASASPEVVCTGSRTREERDAEGRKRAVDLDDDGSPDGTSSSGKKAKIEGGSMRATELERVSGLADLMKYLGPDAQVAAVKWCNETDTDSVEVIVLTEQEDAFAAALGFKPNGNNAKLLRTRFGKIRDAIE